MSSVNNGTMNRIGAGGVLNTFGSVQTVDNTKIQELTAAIDQATEAVQEGAQSIETTSQEAVQTISDEVDNAKQEIATAAATVTQYDVPVICPKDEIGCVLIKNAELSDTETIEVLRPTGESVTTPIRVGTSLDTCSLINVGDTLSHWKAYGATEIKFGYQADDYCYRDVVGDQFGSVTAVLGTIDRAQPVQDTFEYPEGVIGTDYVCKLTPTCVESFNKNETNQVFTIELTDENIALYSNVWFGVYTYGSTIGSAFWFHDYAAKYGTIWVTTANGEVVRYTGKTIDFSQFVNKDSSNTFQQNNIFRGHSIYKSNVELSPSERTWGNSYTCYADNSGSRVARIQPMFMPDGSVDLHIKVENGKVYVNDLDVVERKSIYGGEEWNADTNYAPLGNANNYPSYCIANNRVYEALVANKNAKPALNGGATWKWLSLSELNSKISALPKMSLSGTTLTITM